MQFFEKYLTLWVALCIVAGITVGQVLPVIPLRAECQVFSSTASALQ